MEGFTTFLANNYLWFLVIAIILIFALIGYFVDASEQKKGVSSIVKPKNEEKDIHDLAKAAAHKSLNTAISDASRGIQNMNNTHQNPNQNTITEMDSQSNTQFSNNTTSNPIGFDVLNK